MMTANNTTSAELDSLIEDETLNQIENSSKTTEFIQRIENNPTEVSTQKVGVKKEVLEEDQGVEYNEENKSNPNVIVEIEVNNLTRWVEIKPSKPMVNGNTLTEIMDNFSNTVGLESKINDDDYDILYKPTYPKENSSWVTNTKERFLRLLTDELLQTGVFLSSLAAGVGVWHWIASLSPNLIVNRGDELFLILCCTWFPVSLFFALVEDHPINKHPDPEIIGGLKQTPPEDVVWQHEIDPLRDLDDSTSQTPEVVDGEINVEEDLDDGKYIGTITTDVEGEGVSWEFKLGKEKILSEPYKTVVDNNGVENGSVVVKTRPNDSSADVADDEAVSECGEWVLLPV